MWFNQNKGLLVALLIGGIIRAAFLFLFFADFKKDPDAYKQIAINVSTQGIYGQVFGNTNSNAPDLGDNDSGGKELADHDSIKTVLQPTAFRPPLYPLILSLFVTLDENREPQVSRTAVASLHWLLGMVTLWLAYSVGRKFELSETCCVVMTLLVACDPIGLRQNCLPMTETLAVCLATLGIWIFTRKHYAGLGYFFGVGIVLGIFALCRPTFLIWAGLIFLSILFGWLTLCDPKKQQANKRDRRKRLVSAAVFLTGVGLSLTPWTIRNYQVFGKPIFATSHGGYTIFLGNNDSFYDYLHSGKKTTWDGEKELREIVVDIRRKSIKETDTGKIVDEVQKDRLYYQKAKETILRRPGDFLLACGLRIIRFWSILPNKPTTVQNATDQNAADQNADDQNADDQDKVENSASEQKESRLQSVIRYGSAIWYGIIFLLASVGVVRIFRLLKQHPASRTPLIRQLLPGLLMVIAFQGLHLVYWSNMRMRAPLVVVIALLAVIGISSWDWARRVRESMVDGEQK